MVNKNNNLTMTCLVSGTKKDGGDWYRSTLRRRGDDGKPQSKDFFIDAEYGETFVRENKLEDIPVTPVFGFDRFFNAAVIGLTPTGSSSVPTFGNSATASSLKNKDYNLMMTCMVSGTKKDGGNWYRATLRRHGDDGKPQSKDFFIDAEYGEKFIVENKLEDIPVTPVFGFDRFFNAAVIGLTPTGSSSVTTSGNSTTATSKGA